MRDSFFIGGGFGGSGSNGGQNRVEIIDGEVVVNLPLDLYVDDNENVYAGRDDNNAKLIFINRDEIYARRII